MKRFYVGAKHIGAAVKRGQNASCTHETLAQAIDDAKQQIRNGEADCVVVVEIVRVVRRDHPPITVEDVTGNEQ